MKFSLNTIKRSVLNRNNYIGGQKQFIGMIGVLIIIMIISQAATRGNFFTEYNITIIIRSIAFVGLVALGQSLLLLLGELDLSIGSIAGLTAIIGGKLMVEAGMDPVLSFILCVLLGGVFGAVNGGIISALELNPLVVTIGMSGIYKGINLVITRGRAITNIPEKILFLGQGMAFGLPVPFIVMFISIVLIIILTQYTTFGRYIYAIGDSREAAKIVGVRVKLVRTATFAAAGILGSLAGMLMVSRLGSSQPSIGEVWLLTSIAAPVIGGVALTGGIGNPVGAIVGVSIISVIQNVIVLLGVSSYWQTIVSGSVVVIAVSIDAVSRLLLNKRRKKN